MTRRKMITIVIVGSLLAGGLYALLFVDYGDVEGDDGLKVVTTFYPVYYFTTQIAGEDASVSMLIPANTEPHSWSPSISDLIDVSTADVLVYNGGGFEPWIGDFIDNMKEGSVTVDTSQNMDTLYDNETLASMDPHFWLDPLAAEVQVSSIVKALVAADPANADYYQANAEALTARLAQLDLDYSSGLANRTKNAIVTTHEGFDYFASRYHLMAYGAVGITADSQPSAADLEDLTNLVKSLGLKYVFSEPIFSDAVMKRIASETGAEVLVLDGIHGQSGIHADMDYFEIMYANLEALKIGLEVTSDD